MLNLSSYHNTFWRLRKDIEARPKVRDESGDIIHKGTLVKLRDARISTDKQRLEMEVSMDSSLNITFIDLELSDIQKYEYYTGETKDDNTGVFEELFNSILVYDIQTNKVYADTIKKSEDEYVRTQARKQVVLFLGLPLLLIFVGAIAYIISANSGGTKEVLIPSFKMLLMEAVAVGLILVLLFRETTRELMKAVKIKGDVQTRIVSNADMKILNTQGDKENV